MITTILDKLLTTLSPVIKNIIRINYLELILIEKVLRELTVSKNHG